MKKKTISPTQLQKQVKDLDQKFKRALADYQNLQKRHTNQQQDFVKYANEKLLDKLLPVLDNLQRAKAHLKDSGINLIVSQFHQILASEEVKEIKTKNQSFNPETMDCTEVVKGKKDQVQKTLTKGYLHYDKVLRPAQVQVGSGAK